MNDNFQPGDPVIVTRRGDLYGCIANVERVFSNGAALIELHWPPKGRSRFVFVGTRMLERRK